MHCAVLCAPCFGNLKIFISNRVLVRQFIGYNYWQASWPKSSTWNSSNWSLLRDAQKIPVSQSLPTCSVFQNLWGPRFATIKRETWTGRWSFIFLWPILLVWLACWASPNVTSIHCCGLLYYGQLGTPENSNNLLLPTWSRAIEPRTLVHVSFIQNCSGVGITGGVHRLWAHRSYKATFPLRVYLMLSNSIANQGIILIVVKNICASSHE